MSYTKTKQMFKVALFYTALCCTAPEPPTNLTVTLGRNKQASISWSPPAQGDYTGFRFKVFFMIY